MPIKLPLMIIMLAALPLSTWGEEQLDLTDLSLEQLSDTEVISAAHFAKQVIDAPSAVSVVTAVEIERFGYRTIAEILDSMRGIHISNDLNYSYLGGRGYSANEYAGRIMVLIDGHAAADNYYHQIFIGDDGYLDTALIERVEFAPGPGSAIYGNNAFLGVVNIITRKGRDFDGVDIALTAGSHRDREGRVTWGKRFDNGAEWLLSASRHTSDGVRQYHDGSVNPIAGSRAQRLFLKGQYAGWSLEAASADRWKDNSIFEGESDRWRDRNSFINIGYESDLGQDWRTSARLYWGSYRFDAHAVGENYSGSTYSDGRWYGLDGKLIYLGLDKHQLLLGAEYRIDGRQHDGGEFYFEEEPTDAHQEFRNGRTLSLYAEDMITLTPSLTASIGARADSRQYNFPTGLSTETTQTTFNPRAALIYTPWERTSLKLSHGQASRFDPVSDVLYDVSQPSRVRTTELVAEHQGYGHRLLGSLYHYRIDRLPYNDLTQVTSHETRGAELESEWQWPGGRTLRVSYARQIAQDNFGQTLPNVPRDIGKLHFSTPIPGDERLRASLALRYIGKNHNSSGDPLGDYAIADLTLTASQLLPSTTLSLGIRNLFDKHYGHVGLYSISDSGLIPQDGRSVWLQLRTQL